MELIIDGNRGIYAPREFCKRSFDLRFAKLKGHQFGCDNEAIRTVLAGPDHEDYWEAWERILQDFNMNGKTLHQDGDIWLLDEGEQLPEYM